MEAAKKVRSQCLKNFTRSVNSFNDVLAKALPLDLLTRSFEKVQTCYEKLEAAQDNFVEVDDAVVADGQVEADYLDEPAERYQKVLVAYGEFKKKSIDDERSLQQRQVEDIQKSEDDRRVKEAKEARDAELAKDQMEKDASYNSSVAEFEIAVDAFSRMNTDIKGVVADASDADKRDALGKLEIDFQDLRTKLVALGSIDSSKDTKKYQDSFIATVEKPFTASQKCFLSELKDSVIVNPPSSSSTSTSSSSSSSLSSNTKKEAVTLPSFKGDLSSSPSPYLLYPVWRKRWDSLIKEYDAKFHANFLLDRLDDAARLKFVGYEEDYDSAMKRLDSFYSDPLKVVSCVMSEVNAPSAICEGDYMALISYCGVLENNFNRLKSMNLDHEMSNTSSMSSILCKFPNSVGEKWAEHIVIQNNATKSKPFPAFVEWLISQKEIWERVAAVEATRCGGAAISSAHFANTNRGNNVSVGSDVTCFNCGKKGHKRKECPTQKPKQKDGKKRPAHPKVKKFWCAFHKDDTKACSSVSCQDLRRAVAATRIQLLKDNKDCVHCCGDHESANCNKKTRICGGGTADRGCTQKHAGHELFCVTAKVYTIQHVHSQQGSRAEGVVLLITNVRGARKGKNASVFWDLGSTSNFVREEYAKRMRFKGKQERLCVTTLTGTVTDYTVTTYNCSIRDKNNEIHYFEAYGLESITGALSTIDSRIIKKLFPNLSDETIQSLLRSSIVDFLIGMKHPSWHPERAERSSGGGDIWLYRGKFGTCVGGSHPDIREETSRSDQYFTVNFVYHTDVKVMDSVPHALEYCPERISQYVHKGGFCEGQLIGKPVCNPFIQHEGDMDLPISGTEQGVASVEEVDPSVSSVKEPVLNLTTLISEQVIPVAVKSDTVISTVSDSSTQCHATKTSVIPTEEQFFRSEALGTTVSPECGGCKCGKCPIPGSKYNLQQQQDLQEIERNLKYNAYERRWYTVYPWLCSRSTLPKNDRIAYQSLLALERKLSQDTEVAEEFCFQIEEMIKRGSAVLLSEKEFESWDGDYYFLPLVGVKKDAKKWLRVCFDASRRQGGYPSMNECLRKGPDRFLNNLLSVQLGFRNGRIGCAADISKFHNQVYLEEPDVYMQLFMWRSMNTSEKPRIYAVRVNNFGVKPANCIATSALYKSADEFKDVYPEESEELKRQTYIDDELVAAVDKPHALIKTSRLDEIGEHAGMPNKGWTFTGDDKGDILINGETSEGQDEKVLGTYWDPKSDTFKYHVTLCFKGKNRPDIKISTLAELDNLLHELITKRSMLSNVHRIFDPMGLLLPILLQAKLLLRSTWIEKGIGWDDPLPEDLRTQWIAFLTSVLSLRDVSFQRSLWPEEEVVGLPILVVFTDGSALAFGAAAYIRWELASGGFWSRLIMAKGKIAPKNIVSIPRMELNCALVGNRVKNFLQKETGLKFKVYQLVDSSTVLGYVHKECGIFHPYEGIRIAEIQSTNQFSEGKLEGWGWVSGDLNPADWCTKTRSVEKIIKDRFWPDGPGFLLLKEEDWPIKFTYKTGRLEGEVVIGKKQVVFFQCCFPDHLGRLIDNISIWTRLIRCVCWLLRLRISGGVKPNSLSSDEIQKAKTVLIKYAQKGLVVELSLAAQKGVGRFRKLAPICDTDGVWRVGSRLKNFVPFTADKKMPAIIPPDHRVTLLVMRDAHNFSHAGIDGTLSRFHMDGFWTVRAGHLAKAVKNKCVPCRKVDGVAQSQIMGDIPEERLRDLHAWGYCQIDLFGPFSCRGDVNPRTSKKTWGIIVEDANSGAVHLDIVQDYSADAVIMSMRRFGCLRGWPSTVQSDPGSQLVSASGKLVSWWNEMYEPLQTFAGSELKGKQGFKWEISPADSPWRQGKAERRIAIVKRLIKLSVGDTRLSPLELQTALMEIANLCNERPLGGLHPRDDGSFEVLTPNQLMTGRSGNLLPDDTAMVDNLPMAARYRVVSHVSTSFWQRWCILVGPSLVTRQKWHQESRNITVGDLVMIADSGKIKGKYKLGIVIATNVSGDGLVRSATVQYFNKRDVSVKWTPEQVVRSVQRLSLILPVEEQDGALMVKDCHVHMQVCGAERS